MKQYSSGKIELTEHERRLLYELGRDARQPLSQLARKLKVPKTVLLYRLKRLEDEGVIRGYSAIVNTFCLGYTIGRFYIKLQYADKAKEEEIISYFTKDPRVLFVATALGRYDLVVMMWIKNADELHQFWQETSNKYRQYFMTYLFCMYMQYKIYSPDFLIDHTNVKKEMVSGGQPLTIDETDKKILQSLSKDARKTLIALSKEVGLNPLAVKARMQRLIANKILLGFTVDIDLFVLGYRWFKLDVFVEDPQYTAALIARLKENPHLSTMNTTIGSSDLEPELYYRTVEELDTFLSSLKKQVPKIRNCEILEVKKMYKLDFMPRE